MGGRARRKSMHTYSRAIKSDENKCFDEFVNFESIVWHYACGVKVRWSVQGHNGYVTSSTQISRSPTVLLDLDFAAPLQTNSYDAISNPPQSAQREPKSSNLPTVLVRWGPLYGSAVLVYSHLRLSRATIKLIPTIIVVCGIFKVGPNTAKSQRIHIRPQFLK